MNRLVAFKRLSGLMIYLNPNAVDSVDQKYEKIPWHPSWPPTAMYPNFYVAGCSEITANGKTYTVIGTPAEVVKRFNGASVERTAY